MPESRRSYPSLLLRGTSEEIDAATSTLFEGGCLGTETVEGTFHERAYFPPGTDLGALSRKLSRVFPHLRLGPIVMVPEEDWLALWRKELSGFTVGGRFYICPSWQVPPRTERIVLRIDPEQAFGTGTHDTTRLCLELIEDYAGPGIGVIDAGAGSGILSVAAAALGSRPVLAIEADPPAASCALQNVKRNGLDSHVEVVTTSLEDASVPPAELVVANLNRPLLDRELGRLAAWLRPRGRLILSGLTVEDVAEVSELVESLPSSMKLVRYYTAGGWAAMLAQTRS